MDPANPTSEHLHPIIVPHCLCVMHLLFHCVWGCGRSGWAWEVSRHSPPPCYSLCALKGTLTQPPFLHFKSTAVVELPRAPSPCFCHGCGAGAVKDGGWQEPSVQTASPGTALLCACCGTPLSAPAWVRGCTEALLWSGISLVPSSTCHTGRSRQGTVRQAWAPTPHTGFLSPGNVRIGPAPWQGVGEAARK